MQAANEWPMSRLVGRLALNKSLASPKLSRAFTLHSNHKCDGYKQININEGRMQMSAHGLVIYVSGSDYK